MFTTSRGTILSLTRFARRSTSSRGSARPRTCFVPSSTPITIIPPAVLANATMLCNTRSGDDRSRLTQGFCLPAAVIGLRSSQLGI